MFDIALEDATLMTGAPLRQHSVANNLDHSSSNSLLF